MLRRLPFIIFLFVAFDFLLLAAFCYWFGWKPALAENGVTTIIGLVVILYYEWRWSGAVAETARGWNRRSWTLGAWRKYSFWSPESCC